MKSKIAPVLVICAMAGLVNLTDSCKKDEDASSTLIVKVLYGNQPMSNVHVFTVPYTSDAITDVYGLTKIEGISSGEYQVYAESGNVTGKSIVILEEKDAQNVTVGVNYTGFITLQKNIYNASGGFSVDVMEVSPGGDYFCVGDDAYFRKTDQTLASVAYLQDSDPATDFAFNDEGSITWCCSDKRSLIQEYHYPSGALVRVYFAYGRPLHMVFRDNSCIVATLTGFGSECCVEVIPVGK